MSTVFSPSRQKRIFTILLAFACLTALFGPAPAQALSSSVVISQVYGGGGNASAPYRNDFVELFNRGTTTVTLSGWSVQYASATGTGNFGSNPIALLSGSLAPGQHYLIQLASGGANGVLLPTPDATGTVNMSGSAGKVALINTTIGLACNGGSTPCSAAQLAQIVDLVGYGNANFYEGSGAAPTLSNTTAALRGSNGCVETDNNNTDFSSGAPNPRNTSSPLNVCSADLPPSVTTTTPASGATNVALNANITINFSEAVNVTGSWFSISCVNSGAHTATVTGGPTTFTLDPATDFVGNESCTVTVFAAQVSDQDADDPPDNMLADKIWSFTTLTPTTPIHDIQGASHISPYVGMSVTMSGIVTAKRSNGFYLQDPNPDANDATSEGIFVFTSSAPTVSVGDSLFVSGTVAEFRPGGSSSTNLTTTEITSPSITVQLSGNVLPAPIILGTGGRIPPTTVIEDDATGDVETSGVFDPANDGIDFYESLEGMRVQVNNAVAVGPWHDFTSNREIPIVGDNGANASVRTNRGGIVIRANDFNPERIILNDLITGGPTLPSVNVGASFPGAIIGVMDYSFGNYKLQVSSMPAPTGGVTQELTTAAGINQLAVATFNVENLDPNDPQSKFDALASLIVNNLKAPDVIAIEEIQDNNGPTNDPVVAANLTFAQLIAAIQAAGGLTYDYRQIDPVDDQDGGEPGGNIRQGFLFRTDRGLTFIDRPGAGSTTANAVVGSGSSTQLQFSPGRIDPTNTAFSTSRKPLAGEFSFNGHHLFVIANHFNSKGGDQPLYGHLQPPTRSSETQRGQQAQVVHDFVNAIVSADANADVIVLGDLNDFEFSGTMNTLKGSPAILNTLIETLPQAERYTYVFEGNSQAIDHTLFSNHLTTRPFVYDVVHVNSEFATQASDHEPQVVRVTLNDPPTANAGGPYTVNEGSSIIVTASGTDPESGALAFAWDLDNNGTFETPGQSVTFSAATLDGPNSKTIQVQVTDNGGLTAVAQATVNIQNVAPSAVSANPSATTINENDTITLSGSFVDPGTLDTHTVVINWGDGSANTTLNLAAGVLTYSTTHKYLDDNPTGTSSDINNIGVTVTDKDGASAGASANITVKNVTPSPTINGAPATSNEGVAINLTSTTGDPGTQDTFTYAWSVTKNGNPFGLTGSSSSFSFTPDDNGTYVVKLVVTDDDTGVGTTNKTITVVNVAPVVSNNLASQNVQYSDAIAPVTITGADVAADLPLTATTAWKVSSAASFTAGLPTGLTFSAATCGASSCAWTLGGKALVAPATYIVRVTVTDKDSASSSTDITIVVTQEDARVTYTGALFASTASVSTNTANVTLAATIQDITAVTGDPAFDPNAGDIRNATLTFVNRDASNAVLCVAPIGLVNPADAKTGTATCAWTANIGNADSAQFTVGIIVGNYYTRNASTDDTIVTVSKPLASEFITGGGYLTLTNSAGQKAGDAGSKNNFGFNVKYNKSGTNLQGNMNIIVRSGGRVYQIKGNAMTSLTVQPSPCATVPCAATFNGKANIQDITDPNNPVSVDGNATLQVTLTDRGEPGSNDSIAITVWNKSGGLWFASKWDGTKTVEQTLAGGNLVVH